MKATLTFNLPDEKGDFELAQHGWKYQSVLYQLDQQFLRPITKHGVPSEKIKDAKEALHNEYPSISIPSDDQLEAIVSILYQEFRDHLHELLNDEGVDIV